MKEDYDYLIKTLLIGSSGVGKSSISNQFSFNKYNKEMMQTVGLDLKVQTIHYENKIFKCQLWDTAGHERFRSITSSYYRGADCVIVVFDLNNIDSFNDLHFWLKEIEQNTDNIIYYLVANKSDLERKVDYSLIEKFIIKNNIQNYIEVSAKDNINIDTLFKNIVNKIYINKIKNSNIIEEKAILPPSLLKNNIKLNMKNNKKIKNDKEKCCILL